MNSTDALETAWRTIEHLRHRLADLEADNAILRAELREAQATQREAAAVMDLLTPTDRPVWQP